MTDGTLFDIVVYGKTFFCWRIMHTSIEVAVSVYEAQVCGYLELLNEIKKTHGDDWERAHFDVPWKVSLQNWDLQLRTMEQVLGLTEEEIKKIRVRAEMKFAATVLKK